MNRFKTLKRYTLYTLLVAMLMVGRLEDPLNERVITNGDNKISIIEVDGCQYILYDGWKAGGLTHKGNCKNH